MASDYGAGEIPQAFCRVAAVGGATYVLRAGVQSLLVDPSSQRCCGVKLKTGQASLGPIMPGYLTATYADAADEQACAVARVSSRCLSCLLSDMLQAESLITKTYSYLSPHCISRILNIYASCTLDI